ncbi:MAG: glycine cleavage system protein H [candidate division Zixibacteria bacterium]|nr:glycine cleavage system protein H [candidate division Zixibacteria bacterium]
MQTLQEFLLATKANEYLIAIAFMIVFILFWRLLNIPVYRPLRELLAETTRVIKSVFTHPSHTWVEVVQPNLVNVGMDKFTSSVFGTIKEIELPRQGDRIYQGGNAWKIKRGERELAQSSPISGRVIEVNKKLVENPLLLNHDNPEKNWILRIEPTNLLRELRNLLSGEMLKRWNQSAKEHLISVLVPTEFPVLQEGGEIKPDLGDELTPQQWEKVTHEFFNSMR